MTSPFFSGEVVIEMEKNGEFVCFFYKLVFLCWRLS